jgi:hypothetical protein
LLSYGAPFLKTHQQYRTHTRRVKETVAVNRSRDDFGSLRYESGREQGESAVSGTIRTVAALTTRKDRESLSGREEAL